MTLEIVFETHSTSIDNERRIASGWLDPELSETGRQQAHRLGQRRLAEHIDFVFSSDLRRAVQTAQLAFGDMRILISHDWRLRECNYGDLNGATTSHVKRVRASHVETPFPNGESYRQVVERVDDFVATLRRERPGTSVVVIGHSATRWALDHLLLATPLQELVAASAEWQPGWHYVVG
jgi:broad specificity phosphatase PhoE